jgi:hypothetical protein
MKEQIISFVCQICQEYRGYRECCKGNKCSYVENKADTLLKLLQFHSYLPIQAGEDGLVDDETRYIIEINTYKEFYPNQQFMGMHKAVEYKLYENLLKAQKALTESQAKQKQADIVVACDMLITELISYKDGKLTFKDIEPSLQRWNQYRIEAFKKQTLEEI